MFITVATLLIGIIVELAVLKVRGLWRLRQSIIAIPVASTSAALSALLILNQNWWLGLAVIVGVFRIINHLRIAKGRMHEAYLKRTATRTSRILGVLQIVSLAPLWLTLLDWRAALYVLVFVQLLFSGLALIFTLRNIRKTKFTGQLSSYSDKELPTVTVAIPARNETTDLVECLRSVLANPYPKLEVLVLDDCSHLKTAEIIKSFAHKGVRFIKGSEPSPKWLAKNHAYDKLADEANGELILFCGVDVRFGPDAIRALVTTLMDRNKKMISVLPRRLTSELGAVFVQPLRYWWELAPPRRLFNRPPVLSTSWLIERKTLLSLGGFDAVSRSILPERFFARELVKADQYSFLRADDTLDIQTRKSLQAQRHTAVRMRYPQIRRRLELAMGLLISEIALMIAPFVIAFSGLFVGFSMLHYLAAISCVLLSLTHVFIVQISNPANVLVAAFSFPVAVIIEIFLSLNSMFKYEFSIVEWRGRNICIPVMRVIPPEQLKAS